MIERKNILQTLVEKPKQSVINLANNVVARIKKWDQEIEASRELFFTTPPAPGTPETRRRGEIMLNGVMFYDEKWSKETGRWEQTGRDYWSSR